MLGAERGELFGVRKVRGAASAVHDANALEALPDLRAAEHGQKWAEAGAGRDEPKLSAGWHVGEREEALRLALHPDAGAGFEACKLRCESTRGDLLQIELERRTGRGRNRVRAAHELPVELEAEIDELAGIEGLDGRVDGKRN